MKQWFKDGPGRYVLVSALLFLAAGCNSSGMAEKTFGEFKAEASPVQRAAVSSFMSTQNFSAEDEETLGEIYERGTPEQQEEMESLASINTVHNPEPASMALMGLGLLGAAWSRRKNRKINRG